MLLSVDLISYNMFLISFFILTIVLAGRSQLLPTIIFKHNCCCFFIDVQRIICLWVFLLLRLWLLIFNSSSILFIILLLIEDNDLVIILNPIHTVFFQSRYRICIFGDLSIWFGFTHIGLTFRFIRFPAPVRNLKFSQRMLLFTSIFTFNHLHLHLVEILCLLVGG